MSNSLKKKIKDPKVCLYCHEPVWYDDKEKIWKCSPTCGKAIVRVKINIKP